MSTLKEKNYFDSVHRMGIIWNIGAILMLVTVPVVISSTLGVWPQLSTLAAVLVRLMPLYWGTAIIEVMTYVPLLGPGGAYLSFVTGNISNLKLPCGIKAMDQAKVRANTEEGEVISTIAIGVSAIVTTVVIAVGVVVFGPFLSKVTTGVLKPAFDYVLPALFGALAATYLRKHWKIFVAPLLVGVLFLAFVDHAMGAGTLMFITIVVAVISVLVLHKANKL